MATGDSDQYIDATHRHVTTRSHSHFCADRMCGHDGGRGFVCGDVVLAAVYYSRADRERDSVGDSVVCIFNMY